MEIKNTNQAFRLSSSAIRDYKSAYLKEYGVLLTDEEAHSKALILLLLTKLIYKPIPKEVIK